MLLKQDPSYDSSSSVRTVIST